MIMAERAADSLAKLGFYSTSTTTPPTTTTATTTTNNNNIISGPTIQCNIKTSNTCITTTTTDEPMDTSISSQNQQTKINTNGLIPNALNSFNPHHRRSKSLRERTGVDQRLERLPSGPPPGQKSVLWTVIKTNNNVQKRFVFYHFFKN
uniref:Uncharacterized protein n=1 Tax=Panagrolaimus superbus TaxID=310955 RepID=A0A914XZ92_9BILA